MALGTPVFGAVAYSAANGTTVSPAYPTNTDYDQLVLIIGMKPSTANGGTVTDPTDWTLVTSITGAGGYGTTLGADTGNTNLFVYTRMVPAGGPLTGSLSVTVGTNNVCWATIGKITSTSTSAITVTGWTSSDTTGGNVSAAFTTGTALSPNDVIIGAMCIPTDVGGGTQFSAQALSATGVTFGTVTEVSEPNSGNGNDIGGFIIRSTVSSGTSNGDTTLTATAGGTTTNVRGPLVLLELKEAATAYTITADPGTYTYTGTAANTNFNRKIVADPGSYSYTGTAANTVRGRAIIADPGSYSYAGTAANTVYNRKVIADPGSYTYTGTAANTIFSRTITADPGSYSYTGTAAGLNIGKTIIADPGSYSYTGTDAGLTYKYATTNSDSTLGTVSGTSYVAISDVLNVSTTASASLTFSGELTFQPQTLTDGIYFAQIIWRYRTVGGSFVDVGSGITAPVAAEVENGGLTITGEVSAATTQGSLVANTNYQVQLYARRTLASPTNTIEFFGTAQVDATGNAYSIAADAGSYSYSGTAAGLIAARKVIADPGSYTYTGTAANLVFGRAVAADPGSYAYSGTAANFLVNRKIAADAGSYSYTGTAATLNYGKVYSITADPGAYVYTGTSATLTYTSGLFNILLGSSTVSSVKLGTTTVTKVYLGTTKVFG